MIRNLFAISLLAFNLIACMPDTVDAGTVVLKDQVCGDVTDATRYSVISGGRYYHTWCADFYSIPTREQRAVWTLSTDEGSPIDESITFSGIDGQPLNVDIGVGYMVDASSDEKIIQAVRTFGPDLERIIDTRVRDQVRHSLNMCAGEYTVQQIYGEDKDDIMTCAQTKVQEEFNPNGLLITRLTLNSEVRLPASIKASMEAAQSATQEADKVRREVDMTVAEGEKKVAAAQAEAEAQKIRSDSAAYALITDATAQAEADRIRASKLTPEVLELKRILTERTKAERWDGKLPETIMGTDIPMIVQRE